MTPNDAKPVFRFAPSPTGALHLGHARSALIGARWAAALGGRFLLRIEDIDTTRLRPEFVDWIFEDLAWLGVSFEQPVLRQSARMPVYAAALQRLDALGLTYPCFSTRTEIAAASDPAFVDPDGTPVYPGLWRGRPADDAAALRASGAPFAIRLDMEKAMAEAARRLCANAGVPDHSADDRPNRSGILTVRCCDPCFNVQDPGSETRFARVSSRTSALEHICAPGRWGDVVLARKETPTSYHLAVVVDDAGQGVTHVTRGMDLLAATDVHRLLQVLLDLPAPTYHHHPLILDEAGRKLSKSAGSMSLRDLRAAGVSVDDVIARALGG